MQTSVIAERLLGFTKKTIDRLPKRNIEQIVFKILFSLWVATVIVAVGLLIIGRFQGDIGTRLIKTAASPKITKLDNKELQSYKSLHPLLKYPEPLSSYTQGISRDPFLRYEEGLFLEPIDSSEHDFVVTSVDRMLLPFTYKGYIEMPDYVVGQINWSDKTIFVRDGSILHDYNILHVSKDTITATDKAGMPLEFQLNKPIFSNELQAILYDTISRETYTIQKNMEIDDYKVIDIRRDYVILLLEGVEIKLDNVSDMDEL